MKRVDAPDRSGMMTTSKMRNHAMRIGATMTVATSPATIRNVADLLDHLGGIDPNRVRMMRPLGLARAGPDRCEHPSGDDLRVRRGSRAAFLAVDDETGDDPLPVEFADVEEAELPGAVEWNSATKPSSPTRSAP